MSKLARLLDSPLLARVVPHLSPETLHQLIRHQGLDACGDLVTCATPAQLTSVLDLDLWRHAQPGRDEQFDVERFGEWIEVLVETGDSVAARTISALDANLIVTGLSRYIRVFDPGIFEPTAQSDDERIDLREAMREADSAEGHGVACEVGGYIVRARRGDAWDSMIALLLALNDEQPDYFQAVMHGCRLLSNSSPEVDGLDDLLMAPEQHLHDVALERERRRSQQGYATPADARAFLQMARRSRTASLNPIVAAYFRAAEEETDSAAGDTPVAEDVSSSIEMVVEALAEAGDAPVQPRGLLESAPAGPDAARLTRLRQLMADVSDTDATAYSTRSRELAFLANTMLAGCSVQSRPFTPREASEAAASICNLGLETLPPEFSLIDDDLVTAFEAGWSVLYQDVSVFTVQQLIATLGQIRCADLDVGREVAGLRRTLVTQLAAGTPWLAREAAGALAMLDVTASIAVAGLLEECPVVPAALSATLERRTTTVSPTAFEFISTHAQIGDIRIFMQKLGDLLSGFSAAGARS